ncbi:protein phosphatase 2C [Blastocystis sp. ATCC 50177/Nand II]|uniref:Protein phosphatase 2C n=1 Tax=Blastocystis sp. subtype 1 (strain ATCC 50177 / NandII) TaxID=478820 RepID=A0A196S5K5_BLAHN|nr:protein phosphatase 2C [Blastocystis sp. ATCC 50177/Nand II]
MAFKFIRGVETTAAVIRAPTARYAVPRLATVALGKNPAGTAELSKSLLAVKNGFSRFSSNPALSYGCLAGSSWFAVYGLTGGFKNVASPHLKVGFDHYPSNNPCEDRIFVETPLPNMLVTGIADGHGGTFVSDIVKMEIGGLVKKLFVDIQSEPESGVQNFMVSKAIALYQELDDLVYNMVMSIWESNPAVISAGACLVTALIFGNHCVVANAGDCRAVLGKKSEEGVSAVALTKDHNIREPEELKKLKAAHPKERDLVKYFDGKPVYVKGMLQPTRCIGDFILKKKEFIEAIPLLQRYAAFNPPYITCTPEVTAFDIREEDEFVVMASDGIWDELENQTVVDIVAESLKRGNSVEEAANTVVEACLAHAAKRNELTLKQMKELHTGQRRRFHDDMSVVVVKLHADE